ncbi:DNA-methyltransferase [Pelagibius litoralis]|uniref:DNA-methyltransferase n=1 Tax=Pelagibius litoralis TaxID=374515 RepID=UPI001F0DECBC|nr:DNA methyltransferase [Pelagibius litoralis]
MAVRILTGDCLEVLATLPAESVDCVVCSPPYWGLRDYGVDGQLGMEPTLGEHIEAMVEVFRQVRRVMKPQATLWLNYGDCYATSPNGRSAADTKATGNDDRTFRDKPFSTVGGVLKPKDLCMMPARLAIALQEDGWWLRSEIIWHKPNPMPESITDRPATAHEKVYLLAKRPRYFYDAVAVREPAKPDTAARYERGRSPDHKWADGGPGNQTIAKSFDHMKAARVSAERGQPPRHSQYDTGHSSLDDFPRGEGRNLRNVWTIATQPFSEAHFATFPPYLIEPCIKAGTSERGVCPRCGAPWIRIAEKVFQPQVDAPNSAGRIDGQTAPENRWSGSTRGTVNITTEGWKPSCGCRDLVDGDEPFVECAKEVVPDPIPATVLDPFGGAGTTGLVADRLGRDAILIELNPDYAELARRRIAGDAGMFAEIDTVAEPAA